MNTLKENLKIINAATITGDSREENIYRELRNLIEEITDKYESPEKLSDEKIDMTATIKQYGYDADEYKKMFGSTERSERDVVENLANLLVEKGYAKADGKKEEPKKPDDEDKAKKIKLLKLKTKAAKAKLALMQLGCVNGVDVAGKPRTPDLFGDELLRDRWQKHWNAKLKKFIYTDEDDNEWFKNERGHYCLLNGTGEPSFSFDWEGRVAYVSGFDADEYEAAKEFCASMVDEKVMRGSGWHFGAEGYDNRSQSWRFFILYGAMAAGVGNTDEDREELRAHAVNILRNEFPQAKYRDEIEEFVDTRSDDELNEDDIIDDFIGWLGDDIVYFLWDRFPDYKEEASNYIDNGQWDDSKNRYENLKSFKIWLDHEIGETTVAGKLFDIEELTDTTGRVTPLYNIDNKEDYFNREDLSFVMTELERYLPKHGKHLDRVWIDENDTYRFEFGEGAYTNNAPADKKWYINAFRAIQERFPHVSDSAIEEFVADGWDNTAELYDNLKAFKEWLDDRLDNYAEGGELFEIDWSDYTERGTVRPLYHCEDLYGDDYDFAEKWLTETLAADNLSIDRMWINERENCYEFLAK